MDFLTVKYPSIEGAMDSPRMLKKFLSLDKFLMFFTSCSVIIGNYFSEWSFLTPVATRIELNVPFYIESIVRTPVTCTL